MELKKYTEDVLIILEKNTELEQLMTNLAEDSALTPAKATIQDIQKRVVKDRIIELTEQYFGNAVVDDHDKHKVGKVGRSRWAFIKGIGTTTSPEAVCGQEEKIEKTETKLAKAEANKEKKIAKAEAKREEKLAKEEANREKKRKKLEEELAQVNKNE